MTRPVYIQSLRHLDALTAMATAAGWAVVTAARPDDGGRRVTASAAAAVVLDLRGAGDDGMAAALGAAAGAAGAGMLVLVSPDETDRLDQARSVGATHFLVDPFSDEAFSQALRFAAAGAERRGGERGADAPTGDALGGFLARDLERGLADDEVELVFQPQVALATGAITGVEALMRWQHSDYEEFGADRLLDAADRAGLLRELSAQVHSRALTAAAAWPAVLDGLRLSLNVTAEDLATPGFANDFAGLVAASGFAADRVTLEITERGLIADPARAAAVLGKLRAAGMRVAIDDFGTGYSSLAYLARLPLDYLKLDRLLIERVATSERDRLVLQGVMRLAESLGLAVIAEGVETEAQRDVLTRKGCGYYQGYLCSPPVGVAALVALVTALRA